MREERDPDSLERFLIEHGIDSTFPSEMKAYLALCRFDPGETICAQGETSSDLYVLVQGKIKIYHTSSEGRTLVISFKTPLETIGDIEYIRNNEIINTVVAVSYVRMIRVSYRRLAEYGKEHAPLLQFLLDMMTKKFIYRANAMSAQLLNPADVRLASYLLSVSYDESDASFRGRIRASELPDIANLLGMSYRHLNRVIRKCIEVGAVERTKAWVVVTDREALRRLAGEESL